MNDNINKEAKKTHKYNIILTKKRLKNQKLPQNYGIISTEKLK